MVREQYPHRLVLHFDGVRSISASDISAPQESELIEDIYRLVTLDDSRQSLALSFKMPVEYEVAEAQGPAGLSIKIKEAEAGEGLPSVYSLRSASFEYGESVGVIEGMLKGEFYGKEVRMLRDQNGTYFVEEGLYETEEEAMARQKALQAEGVDFELFVGTVGEYDLRSSIGQ